MTTPQRPLGVATHHNEGGTLGPGPLLADYSSSDLTLATTADLAVTLAHTLTLISNPGPDREEPTTLHLARNLAALWKEAAFRGLHIA